MSVAEAPTRIRAKTLPTRRLDVKPAAELSQHQLDHWLLQAGFAVRGPDGRLRITESGQEAAQGLL